MMSSSTLWQYFRGFSSSGIGLLATLLGQIVFARLLGSGGFGVYALSLSTVLLACQITDLGVGAAMPRFIARSLGEKRYGQIASVLRYSAWTMLFSTLGLLFFLYINADVIASVLGVPGMEKPLQYLSLFIPFVYILRWGGGVQKGLGHNNSQMFVELACLPLASLLFGALFYFYIEPTVDMVVLGHGVAYFFLGVLQLLLATKSLRSLPADMQKDSVSPAEYFGQSLPLNFAALGGRVLRRGDMFVIAVLLGEQAVGIYRVAYTLTSSVKQLLMPINNFALFSISRAVGEGGRARGDLKYRDSIVVSAAVSSPIYVALSAFSGFFLSKLFGQEYLPGTVALQILCLGFLVFCLVGPVGSYFSAIGKNWVRMWVVLGIGALNIVLNILFITRYGLSGAAIATSASFILLYMTYAALRAIYLEASNVATHWTVVLPALAMIGGTMFVSGMEEAAAYFDLIRVGSVLVTLGLSVYMACRYFSKLALRGGSEERVG